MNPATYGNDHWLGMHMELKLTHSRLLTDAEGRAVEHWWATGTIDTTDEGGFDEELIDVGSPLAVTTAI